MRIIAEHGRPAILHAAIDPPLLQHRPIEPHQLRNEDGHQMDVFVKGVGSRVELWFNASHKIRLE